MDEGAASLPSPPVRADGDRPPTGNLVLRVEEEDSAVDDLITWSQLNHLNIMSPLIPSPCRR